MTYNIKDMNAGFMFNLVENKKGHVTSSEVYISYYKLSLSLFRTHYIKMKMWAIFWESNLYNISDNGKYVFKTRKSAQDYIDAVSGSSVSAANGIRYWTESKKACLTA